MSSWLEARFKVAFIVPFTVPSLTFPGTFLYNISCIVEEYAIYVIFFDYSRRKRGPLNLQEIGVGPFGIEFFVRPHDRDHIRFASIRNVVRVARRNIHDLEFFARYFVFYDLI
jgi:hypothetical protein